MSTHRGHEQLPNPIDGLVNTYYDQLWQQGQEAITFNPAVWLGGIASGDVVWRDKQSLSGYARDLFPLRAFS